MSSILSCIGDPLTENEIKDILNQVVESILKKSPRSILFIPPDITRKNSQAGTITTYLYQRLPSSIKKTVLPATGLHRHMTPDEKKLMFHKGAEIMDFLTHNPYSQKNNIILGKIDVNEYEKIFGNKQQEWGFLWNEVVVSVNKYLFDYDMILSIGQVLPHEIAGMANYHKNILVGVGGEDFISKSHFMGAVVGIPEIIGKADNPIRNFLKLAYDRFIRSQLNVSFLFTVIGNKKKDQSDKCDKEKLFNSTLYGLFYGNTDEVFYQACDLSQKRNIIYVPRSYDRIWVYMPNEKYHSLWLANKAIYRTFEIIKDGGELIIDAPGIRSWGENKLMDKIISTYGYASSSKILEFLRKDILNSVSGENKLLFNLAIAAHLIHGYSSNKIMFVNYSHIGKVEKDFYHKVGFDSISPNKYKELLLNSFPKKSLEDIYTYQTLSNNGQEGENYFINDAGIGFWKLSTKNE